MSKKTTDTKERIVAAAKELFILHGFRGTSTKLMAKEAGVSEMTLFRHFSTKDEVFREVIQPLVSFIDTLQVDEDENIKSLVRNLLEDRLTFLRKEKDLVRLVLMESYLTSMSFNPIAETADKIADMLSAANSAQGDFYLRMIMGFILTCIFLPQKCDGFHTDMDRLLRLLT